MNVFSLHFAFVASTFLAILCTPRAAPAAEPAAPDQAILSLIRAADYEKAFAAASELEKECTGDPTSRLLKAEALLKLNRSNDALSAADSAIELDPNLLCARVYKVAALLLLQRNTDARLADADARKISPRSAGDFFCRGALNRVNSRFDAAI